MFYCKSYSAFIRACNLYTFLGHSCINFVSPGCQHYKSGLFPLWSCPAICASGKLFFLPRVTRLLSFLSLAHRGYLTFTPYPLSHSKGNISNISNQILLQQVIHIPVIKYY